MIFALLLACAEPPPALLLARHPERVSELRLPADSRGGVRPARSLSLDGATLLRSEGGVDLYQVSLKMSHLVQGHGVQGHGGAQRPVDMKLVDASGEAWPYVAEGAPPKSWRVSGEALDVRVPQGEALPALTLEVPALAEREEAMNLAFSGLEPLDFALRDLGPGDRSGRALLLPAPGLVAFDVDALPRHAELRVGLRLAAPPLREDGLRSDGVTLRVFFEDSEGRREVCQRRIRRPRTQALPLRCSLRPAWGRAGRLILESDPGPSAELDYLVLEEPRVLVPARDPRRVVLVFVDTLRADAPGFGGNPRDASPQLDRWAEGGAVFTQARSVSPWTVPGARAALSGVQPDAWAQAATLSETLGAAGFVSEAVVANAFLTQGYGMGRGWSRYSFSLLRSAEAQVDLALAALERRRDEDLLLMVHLMDTHLPYREPEPYRGLWAGAGPEGLEGGFTRDQLRRAGRVQGEREALRAYTRARYDQNVRYVDDQLARLLSELDDDDLVVLFSDHGEELWEHGDVEHGHSLYDELLRVPFVIRGGGMGGEDGVAPGRYDAPVSLLDLAPTLYDLLGIEAPEGLDGVSLVPLLRGQAGAVEALAARPQAFGHLLYGPDGWGVLSEGKKWISREGRERVYDLVADPGERVDVEKDSDLDALAEALAEALRRPVRWAWRVSGAGDRKVMLPRDLVLLVSHPGGFEGARAAYDPFDEFAPLKQGDTSIYGSAADGDRVPRELLLFAPEPGEVAGLRLEVRRGERLLSASVPEDAPPRRPGAEDRAILTVGKGAERVRVDYSRAPVWVEALPSFGVGEEEGLRVLGYLE